MGLVIRLIIYGLPIIRIPLRTRCLFITLLCSTLTRNSKVEKPPHVVTVLFRSQTILVHIHKIRFWDRWNAPTLFICKNTALSSSFMEVGWYRLLIRACSLSQRSTSKSTLFLTMENTSPLESTSAPESAVSHGNKRKRGSDIKFYAVRIGYKPGVYSTWADCLEQVKGFKKAICTSTTGIELMSFRS